MTASAIGISPRAIGNGCWCSWSLTSWANVNHYPSLECAMRPVCTATTAGYMIWEFWCQWRPDGQTHCEISTVNTATMGMIWYWPLPAMVEYKDGHIPIFSSGATWFTTKYVALTIKAPFTHVGQGDYLASVASVPAINKVQCPSPTVTFLTSTATTKFSLVVPCSNKGHSNQPLGQERQWHLGVNNPILNGEGGADIRGTRASKNVLTQLSPFQSYMPFLLTLLIFLQKVLKNEKEILFALDHQPITT